MLNYKHGEGDFILEISLFNLFVAGIPETTLIISLFLFMFQKEKLKDSYINLFFKFLLSCTLMLSSVFLSRNYFSTLVPHIFISILAYTVLYKSVWGTKNLQSFFLGVASMAFLILIETIVNCPFALKLINLELISQNIALATLPTRIIQITSLFIVIKFNISLPEYAFNDLKNSFMNRKLTVFFITVLLLISTIFLAFYVDYFFNSHFNFMLSILAILFITISLILLFRMRNYENFKKIFKNDIAVIKSLVNRYKNDIDKLEEYKLLIEKQIEETKNKNYDHL